MFRFLIAFAAIVACALVLAVLAFPPFPQARLALAFVAVVLAMAVLLALRLKQPARRTLTIPLLLFGLIPLAACATPIQQQLLNNLSADCERHYDGTVSAGMTGGGFNGTIKIDCAPKASGAPAAASGS